MKKINKTSVGYTLQVLAVLVIFGYPSNSVKQKPEGPVVHHTAAFNKIANAAIYKLLPGKSTADSDWPGILNPFVLTGNGMIGKDNSHVSETNLQIMKLPGIHIGTDEMYNRNSHFRTNQLLIFKNTFR